MPISGIPINIGSFHYVIPFYGLLLMSGALAGGFLAAHETKRRGHDPEVIWDMLIWLIIGGIIGARLWHVFTPTSTSIYTTEFYLKNPLYILAVWNGGLGIAGAVIGGAIAMFFYTRTQKLDFGFYVDVAAPALAIGQAIGRWGNFVNQELYGAPTDLPWAITISPEKRLPGFELFERFHPLFLYESLYSFANMFFLLWISRRFADRLKPGDVLLSYLVIYPVGRFFLDFLRLDFYVVGGINFNQYLMAGIALCAALALAWRHRPVRS